MICQFCQSDSNIDLNIPDHLWAKITPSDSPEGGLLCPICTIKRLINAIPEGGAFELIDLCAPWKKVTGTIRFYFRLIFYRSGLNFILKTLKEK